MEICDSLFLVQARFLAHLPMLKTLSPFSRVTIPLFHQAWHIFYRMVYTRMASTAYAKNSVKPALLSTPKSTWISGNALKWYRGVFVTEITGVFFKYLFDVGNKSYVSIGSSSGSLWLPCQITHIRFIW